jgi:hypothetical protein
MSKLEKTPTKYEGRLGEDGELQKNKTDVVVDSPALVADGQAIRIYSVLNSKSPELTSAWAWVVVTTIFCAWTVSFTYAVFISQSPVPHFCDYSPRTTVAVVNVAGHIVVQLIGAMVGAIFDALCWTVISGTKGASLRTFLATKQETGILTVTSLFLTRGAHQLWCILRYSAAWIFQSLGVLN